VGLKEGSNIKEAAKRRYTQALNIFVKAIFGHFYESWVQASLLHTSRKFEPESLPKVNPATLRF
jgi:hypothetical protein